MLKEILFAKMWIERNVIEDFFAIFLCCSCVGFVGWLLSFAEDWDI
jgi:hypothetical protein